jgi:RNA polymerase sigma-70 factor (ECF subfamily)
VSDGCRHRDPADLGGLTDARGPADARDRAGAAGPAGEVDAALATAYRREWAQVLATVVRLTRDVDAAQDAVQEAFTAALAAWRTSGVPANPGAWLTATARRKAVDARRRDDAAERRLPLLIVPEPATGYGFPDDLLRLVFTCCHPALDVPARVALTLNVVCGLPTADIARLFLLPEPTMAARVTRAKRKLRAAGIPYRVPSGPELAERLPAVLVVIYLLFAQGHTPGRGPALTAADLAARAIDLARMLARLLPAEPEVTGLLALLLLSDARRPARLDPEGRPVLLADQDRARWDRALIEEGTALVARANELGPPGPYTLQAAIAAVHAAAPAAADTDWPTILRLYDALLRIHPSPVAALARCMAYAEVAGPAAGLDALEAVAADERLAGYHLLPAARADLLRRSGRYDEAARAYAEAADLAGNAVERRFLVSRSAGMATRARGRSVPMTDREPLEETPEAAAAVEDETTVSELASAGGPSPDEQDPEFREPADEAAGPGPTATRAQGATGAGAQRATAAGAQRATAAGGEDAFLIGESDGPDDGIVPRTGAEQPWEPEDLAVAEGHDPTPKAVERARQELEEDGPAAIERTVP